MLSGHTLCYSAHVNGAIVTLILTFILKIPILDFAADLGIQMKTLPYVVLIIYFIVVWNVILSKRTV